MTSHLLLIIASLLISGELSYCADPDNIRLDLNPLKGKDVPSNTEAHPPSVPVETPTEEAIFCTDTDSAYPNVVLCDTRSYSGYWANDMNNIKGVFLDFHHPEKGDVACFTPYKIEQAEEYPLLLLPYPGFLCNPSFNDTKAFPLTEHSPFSIKLQIKFFNCTLYLYSTGRVTKPLLKGRSVSVIKLKLEDLICADAVAFGRITNEKECVYDGRRCRPVSE